MKRQFSSVVCACASVLMSAGMLYAQPGSGSAPPAGQVQEASTPSQGSKDVDRSVTYPLAQVRDAAKQALTTYGCDIKKEGPEYLECTRDRHVGVLVGVRRGESDRAARCRRQPDQSGDQDRKGLRGSARQEELVDANLRRDREDARGLVALKPP